MQNIASIAKLAIQILSVLLLATIMGNKSRSNNNNSSNQNTSNSNNNNNVFVLVMALPITTDSDDISYKDNSDILILSDSSSNSNSNLNLNDESFGFEVSDTSGRNGGGGDGKISSNNDGISAVMSDSDNFIIELTTIGYYNNQLDKIESFSTVESNNENSNEDDIVDGESTVIFKEQSSLEETQLIKPKHIEISTQKSNERNKNDSRNTSILSKLSLHEVHKYKNNKNSNNNNKKMLPLNVVIDNTSSQLTTIPKNNITRIDNTGILTEFSSTKTVLDRSKSSQIKNSSLSLLSTESISSFVHNDSKSFKLSSSLSSASSSSSSNLLLLSQNSYVPATEQHNIPQIEDNLIALTATNGGSTETTIKTYLGMQSNITSSLIRKLHSSSLTANGDKNVLGNRAIDGNPIKGNTDSSGTGGNSSSSSISRSASNINGHSGVISSFSEAISSKLTLPKLQKTDAPMLNYIFDTYSAANKHHHHDQRYGPHFEDKREGNTTNITVQAGSTIHLNCRISLLQDKTVSWVKRIPNSEDPLGLLTVGTQTYTGDSRFTIDFQYPSNWRLKISNVRKTDEGQYECQISTHPPRVIQINLHVNAPRVMIVDEYGIPLQEKYYEIDSTLQLSCIVRNVVMSTSAVFWSHGDQILNYDLTRGGVSVKTELMDDGANSTLFIAKINKSDSGNYTCSINPFHDYSIIVHILNGESFAELHHGNSSRLTSTVGILLYIVLIIFILQFHQRNQIFLILR